MASDAAGPSPIHKDIMVSPQETQKHGDLGRDVETGAEMVDIDRIEAVYK
jgi:hypothetical protein